MKTDGIVPLKELLMIEGASEILDYRFQFQDILMWPFVRFLILESAINQMFGFLHREENTSFFDKALKSSFFKTFLLYAYYTARYSPLLNVKQSDILMFISGAILSKMDDGMYINRSSDLFANEFSEDTLIIESSTYGKYQRPRLFNGVRYSDGINARALVQSKIFKPRLKEQERIKEFMGHLKQNFCFPLEHSVWECAEKKLMSVSAQLPVFYSYYRKLFQRLKPKLMFVEDAHYGTRAYILKWAREFNIVTGEFQHGCLSQNHPAYNYHSYILSTVYRDYLPQYFLTYGEFWSKFTQTSAKTVSVGNPYLTETKKSLSCVAGSDKIRILFISTGFATPDLISEGLKLISLLGKESYSYTVRPHPIEHSLAETRYQELRNVGFEIDCEDFYVCLARHDMVVSLTPSTTLYESLAFEKPVFVKSPAERSFFAYFMEAGLFNEYRSIDELVEKIRFANYTKKNNPDLWEEDWKGKYKHFINTFC